MSYTPTTWSSGDLITSTKLNKIEQGLAAASDLDSTVTEIEGEVAELKNDFTDSQNLANPTKFTTGAIQSNGTISIDGSYSYYSTTELIPLDANADYTVSYWRDGALYNSRIILLLYTDSSTPVSATYQNISSANHVTFNSGSYKFARFSIQTVSTGTHTLEAQVQKGTDYSTFYEYGSLLAVKLGDAPIAQVNSLIDAKSVLYGKKWWACGDSFTGWTTEQYTPSDYPDIDGLQHYKTYPFWVGTRTGMNVYNFAINGQTMAMPANPGSFTNAFSNGKYQQIPLDVDYITLKFGINDQNHATGYSPDSEDTTGYIPIGEVTDTGTASFCGAYNTVLEWLITNRPFAKIGILVTNGCATNDEYRQKTIAIAKRWGLPWLDENGEARCPAMIRSSNPDVIDAVKTIRLSQQAADLEQGNTHPNVTAHEFESTFIEAFLKSL